MGMTEIDRKALKGNSPPAAVRLAYTIADACFALGCGRTKLYELIGEGQLDARALGGRTIITAESIHRLMASLPPAPIGAMKHRRSVEAAETVDVKGSIGGNSIEPIVENGVRKGAA